MSDLVERLRRLAAKECPPGYSVKQMLDWEAADALEQKDAEIERLRAKLETIHAHAITGQDDAADGFLKIAEMVREALGQKEDEDWGCAPLTSGEELADEQSK